jgi:hypothetical protein
MSQTNNTTGTSPAYISVAANVKNKWFCCISSTENHDINNRKIHEVEKDTKKDIKKDKKDIKIKIPDTPKSRSNIAIDIEVIPINFINAEELNIEVEEEIEPNLVDEDQ